MIKRLALPLFLFLVGCQTPSPAHFPVRNIKNPENFEKTRIQSEEATPLDAYLIKPEGEGPFPALVALHGCAGLYRGRGLSTREVEWGKLLAQSGYVVLFPDSFSTRGIKEICTRKDMSHFPRDVRPKDAYGALRWLQKQKYVKADRIALMGWSNGGSVTLWSAGDDPLHRPADLKTDFQLAIAIYPGCRATNQKKNWSLRLPLEVHMGAADNWVSPQNCEELARKNSPTAKYIAYADAHHDFDAPNTPLRTRKGLARTASGDGQATVGTNLKAREELIKYVLSTLKTNLAQP